jgi:hypothetical protein
MPERASVNELLQLGLESTLGTAVAANRQMALFELVATGEYDPKPHSGQGRKQSAVVLPNKDWTSGKWSTKGNAGDAVSYTEIIYPLATLFGRPTPSTHAGGTNSKDWTFDAPLQGSPANPIASYTAQQGSAAHSHQFAGLIFTSITIKGTRDGVTASGDCIAQTFSTNIALSSSPTKLLTDPILGADWTVYRDTTSAGLGTTQLLRVFEWEYNYTGVYGVIWPGNKVASANTWAAIVELDPVHTARIKLEADTQGDTGFSDVRAGTTEFYRFDCKGQTFVAPDNAINRELKIDIAGKVNAAIPLTDGDDLLEEEIMLEVVEDTTWTHAALIVATNLIAAL